MDAYYTERNRFVTFIWSNNGNATKKNWFSKQFLCVEDAFQWLGDYEKSILLVDEMKWVKCRRLSELMSFWVLFCFTFWAFGPTRGKHCHFRSIWPKYFIAVFPVWQFYAQNIHKHPSDIVTFHEFFILFIIIL